MANENPNMVTLEGSDAELVEVSETVANLSRVLRESIEEGRGEKKEIPVPNVTGKTLKKVFEFCQRHVEAGDGEGVKEELKKFHDEFLNVDQETLFDLVEAANYLNIKKLLKVTCNRVADMMRGKSVDEIRNTFHIENDYSPEEEAGIREQYAWAFEAIP